jgi:hypothetical protein
MATSIIKVSQDPSIDMYKNIKIAFISGLSSSKSLNHNDLRSCSVYKLQNDVMFALGGSFLNLNKVLITHKSYLS